MSFIAEKLQRPNGWLNSVPRFLFPENFSTFDFSNELLAAETSLVPISAFVECEITAIETGFKYIFVKDSLRFAVKVSHLNHFNTDRTLVHISGEISSLFWKQLQFS